MTSLPQFEPHDLPPETESLRQEVREFLAESMAGYPAGLSAKSWVNGDAEFSRKVAAQGWIGMTWPKRYGGHERTAIERYVMIEEMLAAGAPVGLHWIADRQSGPLILTFGTEQQRQDILPKIARGEESAQGMDLSLGNRVSAIAAAESDFQGNAMVGHEA